MKQEAAPRRVLVTGASGFLGKFVSRELRTASAEVIETSKSLGYDLRNEAEAMTTVWLARPDVVVHLARSPLSGPDQVAFAFRDTLQMGMNILHATALARAKLIIVVPPTMNGEEDSTGEANAKFALMEACSAYEKQFGIDTRIIQFSELYGPFSRPQDTYLDVLSMINTFTLARLKGETEVILIGTGEEKRQLLAVTDAAKAIVKACSIPKLDEQVVMTGNDVIEEKVLAEAIRKACGFEGTCQWDGEEGIYMPPPPLDSEGNAKELLGIEPVTPIEQVLGAMVALRMEKLPALRGEETT